MALAATDDQCLDSLIWVCKVVIYPNSVVPSSYISYILLCFLKLFLLLFCLQLCWKGRINIWFFLFTHFQNNRLLHWNPPVWSVCCGFLSDTLNSCMFTSVCMKVWWIVIHCGYYLSLKLLHFQPRKALQANTDQGSWTSPISRNWLEARQEFQARLYWDL